MFLMRSQCQLFPKLFGFATCTTTTGTRKAFGRPAVAIYPYPASIPDTKTMSNAVKPDWMTFGKVQAYPWSVSGLESSIVVKGDQMRIAFDMGYAHREAVKCEHVFISHGHIDHISAIPQHASKRDLNSMKAATYYAPPHLIDTLREVLSGYATMHENMSFLRELPIVPIGQSDQIQLPGGIIVRSFPTIHRVLSQGYIVYRQVKELKPELRGMPPGQIADLVKQGILVQDVQEVPWIAYTGDTTFDIFTNPVTPDIFRVNLLICEATYVDVMSGHNPQVTKARERGHIHLQQLLENIDLFSNVNHILCVHFSDKYSSSYLQRTWEDSIPSHLKNKIHFATLAKDKGI